MDLSRDRPWASLILAMSADGKLTDIQHSAARFGSPADRLHLQRRVAEADATLFGASTLRAYGTTLSITQADVLMQRQSRGLPPQPVHIVCSASGDLDPNCRFFQQPVPRWLLTTTAGAQLWTHTPAFEQILVGATQTGQMDWRSVMPQLKQAGIHRLAVLGGGRLAASLFADALIDELWLTICPLILGGEAVPTPVTGAGWLQAVAPRLTLLECLQVQDELFLHYQVNRGVALE
jgi:5-amino-6-(5-phosphoribosylamino)uracil reductase